MWSEPEGGVWTQQLSAHQEVEYRVIERTASNESGRRATRLRRMCLERAGPGILSHMTEAEVRNPIATTVSATRTRVRELIALLLSCRRMAFDGMSGYPPQTPARGSSCWDKSAGIKWIL